MVYSVVWCATWCCKMPSKWMCGALTFHGNRFPFLVGHFTTLQQRMLHQDSQYLIRLILKYVTPLLSCIWITLIFHFWCDEHLDYSIMERNNLCTRRNQWFLLVRRSNRAGHTHATAAFGGPKRAMFTLEEANAQTLRFLHPCAVKFVYVWFIRRCWFN